MAGDAPGAAPTPVMGAAEATHDHQARRAWIAAHHPDRGGDPDEFIAGLQAAAWRTRPADLGHGVITGYRKSKPRAALRRLTCLLRRHRRGRRGSRVR
jgi:hypothetical protein